MRQRLRCRPYASSFPVHPQHGPSIGSQGTSRRRGFTLIELVVATAILLVVMIGILSAVSFAYTSSTDTEMRNTAKNVASYTLEYLRARTVTRGNLALYSLLNPSGAPATGTYRWYDSAANPNGAMPSMIDVGNLPLQSNGKPCNYTSARVRTSQKDGDSNPNDTDNAAIVARSQAFSFASKHAASPIQTYANQPLAFTSTLQGYVSVRDMVAPASTLNPAPEDQNLARMLFSSGNTASGTYRTRLTDLTSASAWTNLVVRYPGVYLTSPYITTFTAGPTYVAKVYTADAAKINTSNQAYNPYYTNAQKAATQDYRGFRVLTQIVARTAAPLTYSHVQYYDVTVTVLWMSGTREANYELVSRIVAY